MEGKDLILGVQHGVGREEGEVDWWTSRGSEWGNRGAKHTCERQRVGLSPDSWHVRDR